MIGPADSLLPAGFTPLPSPGPASSRCYLITVPIGGGCAWTLTLCGHAWHGRPHTSDPNAVSCPDCVARGRELAQSAQVPA